MEIDIKGSTKMVNSLEKASTPGLMAHVMKVSLLMEQDKVKAAGNQLKTMEISISEHTKLTKRMAMVDMSGQTDAFTKEDSPMTSSTLSLIQTWKRQIDISRRKRSERHVVGRKPYPN